MSLRLLHNDQCHEHEVGIAGIIQRMTGAVRTEGHVTGLDRIGLLTVVIRAFTAQDALGLGLAVVLVEAERAVRLDRYLGIQAALAVQLLLTEQTLDDNVALPPAICSTLYLPDVRLQS